MFISREMENVNEQHVKCQKMSSRTFAFSAHDLYNICVQIYTLFVLEPAS